MNLSFVRFKHSSSVAIKTFDQILCPTAFPIIGHSHLFVPKIGKYSADRFTDGVHNIMKELNVPVIKLMLKGEPIIFTISADDTRTIFQNEGKYPKRPSLDALKMIRENNEQSVGVIASNGDNWQKFRSAVNPLLKKPLVAAYQDKHERIAKLHVQALSEEVSRDKEHILHDVISHCMRYTLDAISVISPVMRVSDKVEKEEVLQQNIDLMDALYRTMGEPPIWSLVKTKAYRKLEVANNYFYNKIAANVKSLDMSKEPFLKALFELENLSYKDKVITAMDIFMGGIDTTATTIAMTLHYLSMDRALQDSIVHELKTPESSNHRLLKACFKETLRVAATAGGNGRYVQNDVTLSGYRVPKGCQVVSLNPVIGTLAENFASPLQYKPERWLREDRTKRPSSHPYAALPFGFGPRMCPGKLIAEQEMVLYLAEVLRKFTLEPVDQEPLGMIFRTNRVPDRKINIKFIRR